jgi:hypothetical protein
VPIISRLRRTVFGISPEEADPVRRGFLCEDRAVATRLKRIGIEFISGYHAALEEGPGEALAARINREVEGPYRGFAFEGAGMGLMILDGAHLTRGAFPDFAAGAGDPHLYMLYVGAGWAFARLPWLRSRLDHAMRGMDPLLRWLALDGYGFHEGYFHWPVSIRRQEMPRGVSGYARRGFDQGLGRSMWFVNGTNPRLVADTIESFAAERRADLWAGAGLAATYAGGASVDGLIHLQQRAGEHAAALAQGSAFAAAARQRGGNSVEHCDTACRVLCGMAPAEAAAIAVEEMAGLFPAKCTEPSYEIWRQRIQIRINQIIRHRTGV